MFCMIILFFDCIVVPIWVAFEIKPKNLDVVLWSAVIMCLALGTIFTTFLGVERHSKRMDKWEDAEKEFERRRNELDLLIRQYNRLITANKEGEK